MLFICFKVFQNLRTDKRIAPHFLVVNGRPEQLSHPFFEMDKKVYQVPKTEVLDVEMKPVMVGGSGGGDDWG